MSATGGCEGPQPSKPPPNIVATAGWALLADLLAIPSSLDKSFSAEITVRTTITAIETKSRPSPRDWYLVFRELNVRGDAFFSQALMRQFSF
jgi:hypothetical protein